MTTKKKDNTPENTMSTIEQISWFVFIIIACIVIFTIAPPNQQINPPNQQINPSNQQTNPSNQQTNSYPKDYEEKVYNGTKQFDIVSFKDNTFDIAWFDPYYNDFEILWRDPYNNKQFASFENLQDFFAKEGSNIKLLMNAGIYNKDGSPTGLLVQNGNVTVPLNTETKAPGNFFLQPNGVFCLTRKKQPYIIKTQSFERFANDPEYSAVQWATQSGPILLSELIWPKKPNINPLFNQNSANKHIRNGVGITYNGKAVFVISNRPVNLYTFAAFFKFIGCTDALYLDGVISQAYIPYIGRTKTKSDVDFGPIIAITEKKP